MASSQASIGTASYLGGVVISEYDADIVSTWSIENSDILKFWFEWKI